MPDSNREELERQIEALKLFPNNNLVRRLRKQINEKLENLAKTETIIPQDADKKQPNLARSQGLKKYHRYIRLVRNNFPQYSYSDIRKQFSRRKKGKESSIPDVVWQNPSP